MDYARREAAIPVPSRSLARYLQYIFFVAGLLAVGYVGFVVAAAHTYQARKLRELELPASVVGDGPPIGQARKVRELERPKNVVPDAPPIGAAIAEIEVPRVGLHAIVVQGDSDKILRLAVGHMPQTALPGESGNMVFAGHRDSFFRALRDVQRGDQIVIDTHDGSYHYEVESTAIVAPTDLSVLHSNGVKELTLITCYPFSWIGSAPQRYIVKARRN